MVENPLTPHSKDLGLVAAEAANAPIAEQVPASFFKQLLGLLQFSKKLTRSSIQKLKNQPQTVSMVAIN